MKESSIEKSVNRYAEKHGWLAYKFVSPGNAGAPDHIYIKEGTVIFIEFKTPGGILSSQQRLHIKRLWGAGMSVFIVDSTVEGKGVIDAENAKMSTYRG